MTDVFGSSSTDQLAEEIKYDNTTSGLTSDNVQTAIDLISGGGGAGSVGPQGDSGATGPQGEQGPIAGTGPQGVAGIDGTNGLQGPIGLIGPQGISGIDGADGLQGPIGLTGPQGVSGSATMTGAKGDQGLQGPIGLTGPQGVSGSATMTGAKGDQGLQGPIGLTGPQGVSGSATMTGAKGDQGLQGPIGLTGPQGVSGSATMTGAKGDDGLQGPIGLTGPQGISGIDGTDGLQGPIGLTGPQGVSGSATMTGAKGDQGLQGPIGLTGPQGVSGSATMTGAKGDQGLQGPIGLTGPQGVSGSATMTGAKGDQGLQGPIGLTGPQGVSGSATMTGAKGDQGLQGPIGLTGPQGISGIDGTDGLQGPIGLTGPQGISGIDGIDGLQGPIGLTGPQGISGIDGTDGLQGPIGLTGPQGISGIDGTDGLQGPIGLTGPQGIAGIDGMNGLQGIQGIQGPTGDTGLDPNGDLSLTGGIKSSSTTSGFTPPNLTETQRDVLTSTAVTGETIYNTTVGKTQVYDGIGWQSNIVSTSSGATNISGILNVEGNLDITSTLSADGTAGTAGQRLTSDGVGSPCFWATIVSSDITDFQTTVSANTDLTSFINSKGQPDGLSTLDSNGKLPSSQLNLNGIATLDSNGKLPASQLNFDGVIYCGVWDASTNIPTISNGQGTRGCYYTVSVAGTTLIDGRNNWEPGDWIVFNGTVWEQSDHTDAVNSVAGRIGAVVISSADIADFEETVQNNTLINSHIGDATLHRRINDGSIEPTALWSSFKIKEYTDYLCALYATRPHSQYIGGSSLFTSNTFSNMFGGTTDSSSHYISFALPGTLELISNLGTVYLFRNGDYTEFKDSSKIAFSELDQMSIHGMGLLSWNIIVTTNIPTPVLEIPRYDLLANGSIYTDITLSIIHGDPLPWTVLIGNVTVIPSVYTVEWSSSLSPYFTSPTIYSETGMTLSGSTIGVLQSSVYVRATVQVNDATAYSNTFHIEVSSYDPFLLGQSGKFALFTNNGSIASTGISTVSSNAYVGTDYPVGNITNVTATNKFIDDDNTRHVQLLTSAYNLIKNQTPTASLGGAFINGAVFFPGVYNISGAGSMPSGTITLNAQGVNDAIFVFQIGGAFAVTAGANIVLINGANAFNVYFIVDGALSFGANCNIGGTFICLAGAIAIGSNCNFSGRLNTISGEITLASSNFNTPLMVTGSVVLTPPMTSNYQDGFNVTYSSSYANADNWSGHKAFNNIPPEFATSGTVDSSWTSLDTAFSGSNAVINRTKFGDTKAREWIVIQLPVAKTIKSFKLKDRGIISQLSTVPKNFRVLVSTDGITWDVAKTVTGLIMSTVFEEYEITTFDVSMVGKSYIGVDITATSGSIGFSVVGELFIKGY
jgi:hypothetical protein